MQELFTENNFAFSWVLILLAGLALILILEYINIRRFHIWISIISLALAMGPFIWYLGIAGAKGMNFYIGLSDVVLTHSNSLLVIDHLTAFLAFIFLITNLLVMIASLEYMKNEDNIFVYASLMLLTTLGMIFVASAVDVIALVVAWELVSIPSYILVAFKKNERESTEGSVKFFIVGAVSSALMLFGASFLFGITPEGLTNYYVIMDAVTHAQQNLGGFVLVGVTMVVAGLGFKMGTVPFHWWLPDVYESAMTPVTTMLAAASKKVGFVAGFRVLLIPVLISTFALSNGSLTYSPIWTSEQVWGVIIVIFAFVAMFTMIVGNVGALVQTKMKRMLAYSSIGQAGYIMLAIASFGSLSFAGGLLHVFAHALMSIGAFTCVMIVSSRTKTDDIEDYKGLVKQMPMTSLALGLLLLSLAGIPPLLGFFSKFYIFLGALENGTVSSILYWAALTMVITSAISVYYYVRVVKYMFVNDTPEDFDQKLFSNAPRVPWSYAVPVLLTTVLVSVMGLFSGLDIPGLDTNFIEFLTLVQEMAYKSLIRII